MRSTRLASIPLQDHDRCDSFLHPDHAAAVLGEGDLRALDLALPRLAAQLRRELGQHGKTGRAHRMALGDETARRV